MIEISSKHEKCTICRKEYTSTHAEVMPGVSVYICSACLEAAKANFIWICISCGKVYMRPKKTVIEKLAHAEMKRAYMLCEDMQIIQGIDMCIACDPEGVLNCMDSQKTAMEC